MIDRRDVWHDLEPLVQNTINAAFEKYIPRIVEQCKDHDELAIVKHEARANNKKNFAIWGIFITTFNAVLSAVLWQFKH